MAEVDAIDETPPPPVGFVDLDPPREAAERPSRLQLCDPNLRTYTRLKLSGADLSEPPAVLFELTRLESLDLSPERHTSLHFKLAAVPPQIANLRNLTALCLDTNELAAVPPELCRLERLERLVLSNNLLTELPGEFRRLRRLKSLHLANNFFEEIPRAVFFLVGLEFLDASDNRIARLPRDVGNLVRLRSLLLYFNLLSTVPEELGGCRELRTLWLGKNKLVSLPRRFGELQHLDWSERPMSSNVDGNPLDSPPLDVCREGPRAIEEYFRLHPEAVAFTTGFTAEEDAGDGGQQQQQQQTAAGERRAHSDDEAAEASLPFPGVDGADVDLDSSGSWSQGSVQSFPGAKPKPAPVAPTARRTRGGRRGAKGATLGRHGKKR